MNKVCLNGRICNDLELRESGENTYLRFNVAVNRRVVKEDGKRDADFISCVAWNKTAEIIIQYLKKGSLIGIEGRIQTGSYDREDGTKAYTTDVIVENFDFLEKKNDGRPAPEYNETPKKEDNTSAFEEIGEQVQEEIDMDNFLD